MRQGGNETNRPRAKTKMRQTLHPRPTLHLSLLTFCCGRSNVRFRWARRAVRRKSLLRRNGHFCDTGPGHRRRRGVSPRHHRRPCRRRSRCSRHITRSRLRRWVGGDRGGYRRQGSWRGRFSLRRGCRSRGEHVIVNNAWCLEDVHSAHQLRRDDVVKAAVRRPEYPAALTTWCRAEHAKVSV